MLVTVADSAVLLASEAQASAPAPARLIYLDNLKSALTAIVVVHHCIGAFAGGGSVGLSVGNFRNAWQPVAVSLQLLDQGWFMAAFFFLSALLTPPSLVRKGARAFLVDRLKRLGLPFALYFWLVAPALTFLVDLAIVGGDRSPVYRPDFGPPWFVAWLLVFNVAYLLIASSPEDAAGHGAFMVFPRPSLVFMGAVGAALGLVQAAQFIFLPAFPGMPVTFSSLPFHCAFFAAGIVASRNRWLEAELPTVEVRAACVVVMATAAGVPALLGVVEAGGGGSALLSTNACGAPPARGGDASTVGLLFGMSAIAGVYCVCATVAALAVARIRCSRSSAASAFAASVSYAVYLVHPVAVVPLTGAFIAYARWARADAGAFRGPPGAGNDFQDCVSADPLDGALTLALGCAVVTLTSLAVVYPLAWLVRRLPVLSRVL